MKSKKARKRMIDLKLVIDVLEKRIWVTEYTLKAISVGTGSSEVIAEFRGRLNAYRELLNLYLKLDRGEQ